jgi:hypothetical protein
MDNPERIYKIIKSLEAKAEKVLKASESSPDIFAEGYGVMDIFVALGKAKAAAKVMEQRILECKKKLCLGCREDFYNGKNSLGVKECWYFKGSKLEEDKGTLKMCCWRKP